MNVPPSRPPRVLLLAPPAPDIYIRDNYCSFSSKSDYYWPPIDLVVQSGLLGPRATVSILDATALRLPFQQALSRAAAFHPGITLFVSGTASISSDMEFVTALKQLTGSLMLGSGGNLKFWPEAILASYPALDGILEDYISDAIVRLVEGDTPPVSGLYLRQHAEAPRPAVARRTEFVCGIPMHRSFPLDRYKVPQAQHHPFVRTLTSYGCPYKCDFCIEGAVPSVRRDQDDLFRELREIAAWGIKEIYFSDNTMTVPRARFLEICKELESLRVLSWFGQGRVDTLDEEIVAAARRSGCHFMMIGVESGSEEMLRAHRKGHGAAEAADAFRLLRRHRIQSLAYFMLGLPGETRETLRATLDLALELPCDYVSFTIATPDPGTPMREALIRSGELDPAVMEFDCSRGSPIHLATIDASTLRAFLKRAHRRFYLRPAYLIRQLASVRGPADFISKGRTAIRLLLGG